jgi:hypothetical protein
MNTPQSDPGDVHKTLLQKLHPQRFPRMSSLMAAILGFVLDAQFSRPPITEIVVTSDGFVLVRTDEESSANHLIGTYAELAQNWLNLMEAAGLTTRERMEAAALFAAKIGFFGRTNT